MLVVVPRRPASCWASSITSMVYMRCGLCMCVYFDSELPARSATDEPVQWRFRAEIAHGRTELGGCTYLVVFVVKCYSMRAGLHGDMNVSLIMSGLT